MTKQCKAILKLFVLTAFIGGCSEAKINSSTPPYLDTSLTIDERVDDLADRMTIEEKVSLLTGKDFWHTQDIDRLGIPSLRMTDCPHGVTVSGDMTGPATCFPTGIAIGATWNPDLINRVGAALGRETRAKGNHILLGPCVDMHRAPLNGRTFESYSEDPYLASQIAVAFVRGVQSQLIGTSTKHFTCNNQQTEQTITSVEIDERSLREIYLPPFRAVVREADAWSVMSSYNLVNGEYTSANSHLLQDILKDEWNFRGYVVSDWRGTHNSNAAEKGLDIEMPGPGKFLVADSLNVSLEKGRIDEHRIDDMARRILRTILKTGLLDEGRELPEGALDTAEHRKLARDVAENAIVLLKNDGNVLPLRKDRIKSIAVIGPNAEKARLGGGGSASVTPFYSVSPLEGLLSLCKDDVTISYAEGCSIKGGLPVVYKKHLRLPEGMPSAEGLKAEYFNNRNLTGEPVMTDTINQLDFSWGWNSPGEKVRKEDYSIRWTGRLVPSDTGSYKIGLTTNSGGSRLYIDNKLLIDDWGDISDNSFEGRYRSSNQNTEIMLSAGKEYDIRVEFYKKGNRASVRLEWEMPSTETALERAVNLAAESDVAIVFAGLSNLIEGGTMDKTDIVLPDGQDDLIKAVSSVNKRTVVVLINGSPVGMEPWIDDVPAVLEAWYPGQEGGNAIARVLFGEINPSGKLPDTFPKRLEDTPSFGNYPGGNRKVYYKEGIFVGYRHYDTRNVEPRFPFGHGLSYTQFSYENLVIKPLPMGKFIVSADITNTGDHPGAEVVQLYIRDIECSVERPEKELRGFQKVFIEPGERKTVTVELDKEDLSYYSVINHDWTAEAGEFEIMAGSSSRDIRLWGRINFDGQNVVME